MQAFIPMTPWLYLLYCSVHYGCDVPSEQNAMVRDQVKPQLSLNLPLSQRISLLFFLKDVQQEGKFSLKVQPGGSCHFLWRCRELQDVGTRD